MGSSSTPEVHKRLQQGWCIVFTDVHTSSLTLQLITKALNKLNKWSWETMLYNTLYKDTEG